MKKHLTLIILLLCSTMVFAQLSEKEIREEKSKILDVLDKYITANETQNIRLMEEVWAIDEDIEAFGTAAGERLRGWSDIRRVFIHQFNTFTDTYISARDQIVNIDETGSVAWFSQMINYNYLLEGVHRKHEGVRYTGVMKKKNGQWKLVQIHLSLPH
jgi:ketosteroid isomerase-like protein